MFRICYWTLSALNPHPLNGFTFFKVLSNQVFVLRKKKLYSKNLLKQYQCSQVLCVHFTRTTGCERCPAFKKYFPYVCANLLLFVCGYVWPECDVRLIINRGEGKEVHLLNWSDPDIQDTQDTCWILESMGLHFKPETQRNKNIYKERDTGY